MIGWIIALAILSLLAVFLFSSVKITFRISDRVFFEIKYLGIEIFSFDSEEHKSEERKSKKENKSHSAKAPPKDNAFLKVIKEYAGSKKKTELIKELFEIIKIILVRLKVLVCHIRFRHVFMDLIVSAPEAADTAILYGKMCAAVAPVVSLLAENTDFRSDCISVRTDFNAGSVSFNLSTVIKLRAIYILGFAIKTAFAILKTKLGEIKYGRT